MRRNVALAIAVVTASLGALVGCVHTLSGPKQIAYAMLYDSKGCPDQNAFEALFKSRLAVGTSADLANGFLRSLGGSCPATPQTGTLKCQVEVGCGVEEILTIEVSEMAIRSLSMSTGQILY